MRRCDIPKRTPIGRVILSMLLLTVATAPAQREAADADITSAINTELWTDNAVTANQIDVTTRNGVVTLEGTVDHLLARDRAEALAAATVGVRTIVNRIKVEPLTARSDGELREAVEDAWLIDPATDKYEIEAEVEDGVVTLRGEVESYAEKTLAETVAKGVRGVRAIENELDVTYDEARSDLEIEREIEARLENDVRVDDVLIDVEVEDGVARLSGTCGSLREKTQATSDAWVAGVQTVDNSELDVQWWARDAMRRKSTYVARTDAEIEQAVEDAFLYDPRVASFQPAVDVAAGTVTLSGTVDNLAAKRAAEEDARNTLGVWRVKNNLKVRTEVPGDEELADRVASALFADPYVERYEIDVEANYGWVYLRGDVETSYEKNQAGQVARKVNGVVGVVNNLESDYVWTWKPDWEIRADVRDELEWSPFVEAEGINVSVDDGIVTLSGTVDSWSESRDAEKNAFQGGAKDVRNHLDVSYEYYGPYGPGYYASPYYRGAPYYGPYSAPYP